MEPTLIVPVVRRVIKMEYCRACGQLYIHTFGHSCGDTEAVRILRAMMARQHIEYYKPSLLEEDIKKKRSLDFVNGYSEIDPLLI